MALSSELISQFAKLTTKKEKPKTESTVYGEVKEYNGIKYVRFDGSDILTPVSSTALVKDGERVVLTIKNHTATVMGNISSPSAQNKDVDVISAEIGEFGTALADTVKTNQLDAEKARIDDLVTQHATIEEELDANRILANEIKVENAEIRGELIAQDARIDKLVADGIDVTELEAKFANIDFANISEAALKKIFSETGLIKDLVVGDMTVSGELVGVTIKGDVIEGGTVKADKLVILGNDGLYYKLNTDGETVEAYQTAYNSLDGTHILAKSITASKITVDDLVAFGATIGGFTITSNSLYSGVKSSVTNTSRGTYQDSDGQFSIGDANNFLRYYKTTDGTYKLEISADAIKFNTSEFTIQEEVNTLRNDVATLSEEMTTNLRIESSRGTVFKNDSISTVLSAVIYRGSQRITDSTALRSAMGPGAYLQWKWQRIDDDAFGVISASDTRLSNDGFTFTISPGDVNTKVTFMCELIV